MSQWNRHGLVKTQAEYELEQQLKERDALLDEVLKAKSCPCGNVGFDVIRDCAGDPEQAQCEFCYCEENSMFNVLTKINNRNKP